jgi:pyruvate dehydrogenase E1 component alpha subunit
MSSTSTAAHAPPSEPDDGELVDILQRMIDGRVYSTRCFNLQRQGRMGTMAPIDGSEAIAAGAASALDPASDWIFPQYREQYALGRFGDELVDRIALYNVGHPEGGHYAEGLRVFPFQISLATQIPHAVGMAWGMKVRAESGCTLTFFGDGSSSEGDFYEAANLAGILKAPVIFVLINNGWAISTPTARQTGAESFAAKAHAFGFPGVQIDGRDPLAVRRAVTEARARAVGGQGPMLIEAVTARYVPHTTADDPTKYMSDEERERAEAAEPVARFTTELRNRGLWDDTRDAEAWQRAEARFDLAWERAQAATAALDPSVLFDDVYDQPTARMERQRAELLSHLAQVAATRDAVSERGDSR